MLIFKKPELKYAYKLHAYKKKSVYFQNVLFLYKI